MSNKNDTSCIFALITVNIHWLWQSQADGRPPCINGDIANQWEWSNFDPSQNQNLLIDYDRTVHNWLRPRDKQVIQNLCQSTLRERVWANTWNIKPYLFYSDLFFPRTRLLKWSVDGFSHTVAQITRNHARKCLFRSARWPKTFRGPNSPEDWRHRRMTSLARCSVAV